VEPLSQTSFAQPRRASATAVQSPQQTNARDLILLWVLWLLGSWTVAFRLAPVTLAANWMVYACLVGLMVMWPALRLCQELDPRAATSQILWDWLCLNLVFQAVVWPLQVSAQWATAQAVWIDAIMATWSLLTGLVLVIASRGPTGRGRAIAMTACLALILAEPLCIVLFSSATSRASWTMWLSPIDVIRQVAAGKLDAIPVRVMAVATLSAAGWILFGKGRRARSSV